MTTHREESYWLRHSLVAGVDEAGRGPLAGPVFAAAVIFKKGFTPDERLMLVADSKQVSSEVREHLEGEIKSSALHYGIGSATVEEIDRVNILNATYLAMHRAIDALGVMPEYLLIDGNRYKPHLPIGFDTIVKGDEDVFSIAAASILAKTARDRVMRELEQDFPQYGFHSHFGYATPQHIDAIRLYGRSPIHRKSFRLKALGEKF